MRRPSSPFPGRRLLNFLCHAHDAPLHVVLTGPVDADLVAIGIVQIGVTLTPWHHARHLCYVEALGLQFAAELINLANLEVQPHTVTGKRRPRPRQVQRDRAVAFVLRVSPPRTCRRRSSYAASRVAPEP